MSKEKQIEIPEDEKGTSGYSKLAWKLWREVKLPMTQCETIDRIVREEGYRKQSEWISVEERLPEDVYKDRKIITVLVCTKSGRVSTSSRVRLMRVNKEKMDYEYTDVFEWSGQIAKKVTHWMPLPEAPKGGAE